MIDIRIMAHPKRRDNVEKILTKLGLSEDIVVWDDRPNGGDAMYTARKAWLLPIDENCTHRLVLQDDVDICNDFITHATAIANRHKTHAVTLVNFSPVVTPPKHTPYYRINTMPGCAIMLPKDIIKSCMDWCETSVRESFKQHDDLSISEYCRSNRILMVCTIPSIVQHLDMQSLLSYTYTWDRISRNFNENPNVDWGIHSVQKI